MVAEAQAFVLIARRPFDFNGRRFEAGDVFDAPSKLGERQRLLATGKVTEKPVQVKPETTSKTTVRPKATEKKRPQAE